MQKRHPKGQPVKRMNLVRPVFELVPHFWRIEHIQQLDMSDFRIVGELSQLMFEEIELSIKRNHQGNVRRGWRNPEVDDCRDGGVVAVPLLKVGQRSKRVILEEPGVPPMVPLDIRKNPVTGLPSLRDR